MSLLNSYLTLLAIVCMSAFLTLGLTLFPIEEHVLHTSAHEPEEVQTATLVFVGDIMLDRYIRRILDTHGSEHVFGNVRTLLESADLTFGNLEGPITDSYSVSSGTAVGDANNMRFTFAPAAASILAAYGFDGVSIGNNHINDFGTTGVERTKKYLEASGLGYVGDPLGTNPDPLIKTVNGISIAFVGYNEFVGGSEQAATTAIREAKRKTADVVVVLAHWGEEYEVEPREDVRVLARAFSDAGADLIIGTHSHVVGAVEDIGTTRVYYSLGNFVFDQYWNTEVRCGMAVAAVLKKSGDSTSISYTTQSIGMEKTGKTTLTCT